MLSQREIDEIRSARIRRRVIHLPVRYGSLGERKRCPVRPNGVYRVKPRIPYAEHKRKAEAEPTRARAVLRLLELCEAPSRTVTISVREPPVMGEREDGSLVWQIVFEKGDFTLIRERLRDRFLRPRSGYTTAGDPLNAGQVLDDEVAKRFVEEAATAQREAQLEAALALAGHAKTLRQAMQAMKIHNRSAANSFKRAEKELAKGIEALSGVARDTISPSQRAESVAPAEVEDAADPPNGIALAPSLERA